MQDDYPQTLAAYKHYDALMVNSIFDGMNLIAKEGPVLNTRDGVLILSENTGAAEELHMYSVIVNPFDIEAQAAAIHEALTMSEFERRVLVRSRSAAWWTPTASRGGWTCSSPISAPSSPRRRLPNHDRVGRSVAFRRGSPLTSSESRSQRLPREFEVLLGDVDADRPATEVPGDQERGACAAERVDHDAEGRAGREDGDTTEVWRKRREMRGAASGGLRHDAPHVPGLRAARVVAEDVEAALPQLSGPSPKPRARPSG